MCVCVHCICRMVFIALCHFYIQRDLKKHSALRPLRITALKTRMKVTHGKVILMKYGQVVLVISQISNSILNFSKRSTKYLDRVQKSSFQSPIYRWRSSLLKIKYIVCYFVFKQSLYVYDRLFTTNLVDFYTMKKSSTFQMKKLRFNKVKEFDKGQLADKWQYQDSKPNAMVQTLCLALSNQRVFFKLFRMKVFRIRVLLLLRKC